MTDQHRGKTSMVFNVLAKREGNRWIGHVLELDIVATADSIETLKRDIGDLIFAQVSYAFSNDNLEYLYRPAPPEVWEEFYKCHEETKDEIEVKKKDNRKTFVPPWIIAKTYLAEDSCLA